LDRLSEFLDPNLKLLDIRHWVRSDLNFQVALWVSRVKGFATVSYWIGIETRHRLSVHDARKSGAAVCALRPKTESAQSGHVWSRAGARHHEPAQVTISADF
jgi:hypothetical protein